MKHTLFCLATVVLALIASTANAAQLTTQIVLLDPTTLIPFPQDAPNHYNRSLFSSGQTVLVQVQGIVNNPNMSANDKATAVRNKPLGIQNVAGKLLTPGTLNKLVPVSDPGVPFPTWNSFIEYIGTGNPGFANIFDGDGDGDLDVNGAGTANAALSLSSAGQLAGVQVGALGMTPFFEGLYQFNSFAPIITLSFLPETVKLYVDPPSPASVTALAVEDGLATYIGPSITIEIVPEPSTYALAGLGLVGLVIAMRRKKNS